MLLIVQTAKQVVSVHQFLLERLFSLTEVFEQLSEVLVSIVELTSRQLLILHALCLVLRSVLLLLVVFG